MKVRRRVVGIGVALVLAGGPAAAEPNIIADPLPVTLAPAAAPWGLPPAPTFARAVAPDSGLLLILAGSGLLVGGVADVATGPLCQLSAIRSSAQGPCIGVSVGVGVALIAGAVPLLIVGARRRAAWIDWTKSIGAEASTSSASLVWRTSW